MSDQLTLLDERAVADLNQFVQRARRLDDRGALWVRAVGSALVVTASPLFAAGLTDPSPTVLAIKVLPLAAASEVSFVSEISAVADRIARMKREGSTTLRTPPVEVREVWTAVTPPREGWEAVGEVDAETVRNVASAGITEIRDGVPDVAGELAVHELRGRVWGRSDDRLQGLVAGVAFTLDGYGFLRGDARVRLLRTGRWQRAAGRFGDVIAKPASR